jgi:hypothetical protein
MRRVLPSILAIALLAVSLICVQPASAQHRGGFGFGGAFRARLVNPFIPSFGLQAFAPAIAVNQYQLQSQVVQQQAQVMQVVMQPAVAVAQTVLAPSFAGFSPAFIGARFAARISPRVGMRAGPRVRVGRRW